MGNRGNVVFVCSNADGTIPGSAISPSVYLHWNGSAESIYPFLDELDRRNVRADADYEAARFVHVVGDFFDADLSPRDWAPEKGPQNYDGCSLGMTNGPSAITAEALGKVHTDNSDNGFFVVDRSGDRRRVRRFVCDGPNYELVEWSAAKVEAEAARAYEHEYAPAMRERFDNLLAIRQRGSEIETLF